MIDEREVTRRAAARLTPEKTGYSMSAAHWVYEWALDKVRAEVRLEMAAEQRNQERWLV